MLRIGGLSKEISRSLKRKQNVITRNNIASGKLPQTFITHLNIRPQIRLYGMLS